MSDATSTGQGPLFETAVDRILASLSFDDRGLIRNYFEEPFLGLETLSAELSAYVAQLPKLRQSNEFFDIETARDLGARCGALLDAIASDVPDDHQHLVQVAIRYFIEDDDHESDSESPIGYDDDAEVVAAVAKELGREDILEIKAEE